MYLIILALVRYVSACDIANNVGGLNPDCNWAGYCQKDTVGRGAIRCVCCEPWIANQSAYYPESASNCGEDWVCDPENPTERCYYFLGTSCTNIYKYFFGNVGFRRINANPNIEPDIDCNTDPYDRATNNNFLNLTVSLHNQVVYLANRRGWPIGAYIIDASLCDTCSPLYPCTLATDVSVNVTSGITFGFQVQFNAFYNNECNDPAAYAKWSDVPDCLYNFDYGIMAKKAFDIVFDKVEYLTEFQALITAQPSVDNMFLGLGWNNTYMVGMGDQVSSTDDTEFIITTSAPTRTPSVEPTAAPTENPTVAPTEIPTLTPTDNPTVAPTILPTEIPTIAPTIVPTADPTAVPTSVPTATPTAVPTQTPTGRQCGPYANSIDDIKFIGNGVNCRAGLNMSYPGGLTCESPYIVCLPLENTPAQFGYEPYYSSTHRYSVEECKQECANDQRCLGIEFVPDHDSVLGDCNLIDDIPLEITGINDTNGTALCYEKKDACYPYFEADDLEATMLNCYCPNNRKGFYTKKVKRTVENTRFCGIDTETEERIQKAHANRMFHLCENWCLFDTENPTEDYWLWDPWRTCWREQEDSSSYCTHIIEDPLTIEMQFLINRRDHFCQLNSNASVSE